MSERDEVGDHAVIFAKAVPVPVEWSVTCPTCGDAVDCHMSESDSGAFVPGDEDGCPFVSCRCGTYIEPFTVAINRVRG